MRILEPGSLIQVWAGNRRGYVPFDVFDPQPEDIHIETISHGLSNICRFGGHCIKFYSVAQHSALVAHITPSEDALYALLHDASEAYIGDIVMPLKRSSLFDSYEEIERKLQAAIYSKFGLKDEEPNTVKIADLIMLATEKRDLFSPGVEEIWYPLPEPRTDILVVPCSATEARAYFMSEFIHYYDR